MNKIKLHTILIFVFLFFIAYSIFNFFQIKPFMNSIFKTADRLVYYQKLKDSTFKFLDENENYVFLSTNDSLLLNFISKKEIDKKLFCEGYINVILDTNINLKKIKIKYPFDILIFKCDTTKLPLYETRIISNYQIKIFNHNIYKTELK